MAENIPYFEYIVVGCGGIGSGAVYWLAKRANKNVLGLEQFDLGHENGGSQDHSRIIRLTYHDEMYTKLTPHTYDAWETVERESGLKLVHKSGCVDFAKRNSAGQMALEQYANAMSKQNIPFEKLVGSQISERYPQFQLTDEYVGVFQKDGGLVDAALGNALHIQLARGYGATIIDNAKVINMQKQADGCIIVTTSKGSFRCRRVVVAAGGWINNVLGTIGVHIPVTVTQENVTYFATPHTRHFTKDRFPAFIYHSDQYDFYGMAIHGNSGTKIGIDAGGPPTTADTRTFEPDPVREQACINLCKEILPKYLGPILVTKTCLYTMTRDRVFMIDSMASRGFPEVIVCCGAGHAYKFASLFGKILSELAIDGKTQYDIDPFKMEREAILNPDFKPIFHCGFDADHQPQAAQSKL